MGKVHNLFKYWEKYLTRGILWVSLIISISAWMLTYALSENFTRNQIEYLIWLMDANIAAQHLDEASTKNVYRGLREIYKWVIAVLDQRIWDTQWSADCVNYTDPIERAICESTKWWGSSGTTAPNITLSKYGVYNDAIDWASASFEVITNTSWKGYYIIKNQPATTTPGLNSIADFAPTKDLLKTIGKPFNINQVDPAGGYKVIISSIGIFDLLPKTNYIMYFYVYNDTSSGDILTINFTTKDAPIPYNAHFKKVCQDLRYSGNNVLQDYVWYDTDGKPKDIIKTCSQTKRANGWLICSESTDGCCPNGSISVNGTCITPVDAGWSCYATSWCKDGLSCTNHICTGTATGTGASGSGTTWGGSGGTTVVCTWGAQFNFSSNGKNCVGIMPPGPTINYQTTVNAIQWQGTATVKCTSTWWSVITPNCTVDKNTGGGTSSSGTATAPSGYQDISCPSGTNSIYWPCGNSSINEYNPVGCGVDRITQYKSESFYSTSQVCNNGMSPLNLKLDRTTNAATWYCVNNTNHTSVQCKSLLSVDASCGVATEQSAPLDAYNYFVSSNTALCKTGKLWVITPGGIWWTWIWKVENTSWTDATNIAYYANANYTYKCDGIGAGVSVTCKTGKIKEDAQCGTWPLNCKTWILNTKKWTQFGANWVATKTYEESPYDSKVYWDGEYNWTCDGIGWWTTVECSVPNGNRNAYCGTYNGESRESIKNWNYNILINRTNRSVSFNWSCTWTYPTGVTCSSIDYPVWELCVIPTWYGGDASKLLTIVDDTGTDGTFNWKCASMDKVGGPTSPIVECSAKKIIPGKCGTNNGTTLTWLDNSSSFYQSWGAPIVKKYCEVGYPTYTDEVGTDGTFNWYCYVQGTTNVPCSANKSWSSSWSVIPRNEHLIVALMGAPYWAGTYSVTRWQEINGSYSISDLITNVGNLSCKAWYSTNSAKDRWNDIQFTVDGGISNTSTNRTNNFTILFNQAVGINESDLIVTCGGKMNWQQTVIQQKFVIKINDIQLPTIQSFTIDKTAAAIGENITLGWNSQWANGCTLSAVNGNNVFFSLPGKPTSWSLTIQAPDFNGIVTYRIACANQAGYSPVISKDVKVGNTNSYTYSWSFSKSNWTECSWNCWSWNGKQTITAKCLRSDSLVSDGMCSWPTPTESQTCTAPTATCTRLSCPKWEMTKTSPDNTNTCSFTWEAITWGNSKSLTLADGSSAQGYCNIDGTWGAWEVNCKNTTSTVSCAGWGRPFSSADGTNSCYASYEQRNAGQGITVGNGLTISWWGSGNATCTSGGYWVFSVNCPGQTLSCPGGAGDLPAQGNDPACVAYYPITPAWTWWSGTTNYPGWWVKWLCKTNGEWDATTITFDCKL